MRYGCPRCGYRYVCGCASKGCKARANGLARWKCTDETESCGNCGLEASVDQWFEEELWQLSRRGPLAEHFEHPRATKDAYLIRPHKWRAA